MVSKKALTLGSIGEDLCSADNKHFSVDRSCIPTVPQDSQNDELYKLGIHIYEQDTLEKEILHQVDKALEKEQKKKTEVVSSTIDEDIREAGKIENNKLDSQNKAIPGDSNKTSNTFADYEFDESEMDKKIKMGEMTPFGTFVSIKASEENCFINVEKYLKDQTEAEERRKELKRKLKVTPEKTQDKDLEKKKESFVKKSILVETKKRKKQAMGSHISIRARDQTKQPAKSLAASTAPDELSFSEYLPSESDVSESDEIIKKSVVKKKKRKYSKRKTLEDWHSDDSDWDYSDEEQILGRKSKSGKKEQDDGDLDHYLRRLSAWEKSNNRTEIETHVKNLNGGFNVPLVIWNRLFNYQKVGVQWLWELHMQRCGGILGDEMGLGKTVQVIAFLCGLSISKLLSRHGAFKGLGPVLIICPTTVMHQWVKELHHWWPPFRAALMHESGNYHGKRSNLVHEIIKGKGVLVTSYLSCVQQIDVLIRFMWHYVILDEGHKIRNPDSQIANAVKQLKTPHRLILSGSPMQNNLKELWSLFDFIFPGKLGTLPVFMSEFAVPITQGGYTNASQVQVATAYKCATVLKDTISPYLLRRVKDDVKSHINLPMKNEQVLFCKLTDEQRELYIQYLKSDEIDSILSGRYKIFVGLINLRKICNHPHLYTGGPKTFKWDIVNSIPEENRFGFWKKAGKMIVVQTLLKIWKKQDHRVLIFTQSKQMLSILESFVQLQGYNYLKLDGSTNIGSRQPLIRKFNEDRKYFIFLSTTRVGGLGINLTGADRVVIYDPDWNPATDIQARERAWRIGQTNQVTIYRLVTSGTIEEKIYHRQIFKQFLTNKVLKDPKQRRFFKSNDLYELFTFKDAESGITETSALFAGSGSEVNLKRLSRRVRSAKKMKSTDTGIKSNTSDILSREKVESMKKLAKLISQKISNTTVAPLKLANENEKNDVCNLDSSILASENELNNYCAKVEHEHIVDGDKHVEGKVHRKRKKKLRFDTFEGEVVPHLMNKLKYKECTKLDNTHRKEQDDYILKKLFSKSGIKTAMHHDRIMEEGPADYALVEGEAERVAKEAVRALKESRRQYFQTLDNPQISSKPRFGAKPRKKSFQKDTNSVYDHIDDESKTMSSSELLSRIRERNRLLSDPESITHTECSNDQLELLTDIRNFVSFQADVNNLATTQEIINK